MKHCTILLLMISSFRALANPFDQAATNFFARLDLSSGILSTNDYSVRCLEPGMAWVAGSMSNHVDSVSTNDVRVRNARGICRVTSTNGETDETAEILAEEFASPNHALRRYAAPFSETAMDVDSVLSRCERRTGIGDICLVRFPVGVEHLPTSADSVHVLAGNVVLRAFGESESNLVLSVSSVLDAIRDGIQGEF